MMEEEEEEEEVEVVITEVICRRSQVSLQIKFSVVTRGAGAGVEGVDQQVSLVEPWLLYTVCPRLPPNSLIQPTCLLPKRYTGLLCMSKESQ